MWSIVRCFFERADDTVVPLRLGQAEGRDAVAVHDTGIGTRLQQRFDDRQPALTDGDVQGGVAVLLVLRIDVRPVSDQGLDLLEVPAERGRAKFLSDFGSAAVYPAVIPFPPGSTWSCSRFR